MPIIVYNGLSLSKQLTHSLVSSPQEVLGLQKSRAAKEVKAGRDRREACGLGSPQYGRYFVRLFLPQACSICTHIYLGNE